MSAQSRSSFANSSEWVVNSIKRNPEGLLLLAAGACLLLRTSVRSGDVEQAVSYESQESQSRTSSVAEGGAAVQKSFDAASEAVSQAARQTADTAASYASAAADYVEGARQTVRERSESIARQSQSVFRTVVQQQPLAVVVAGIAAGAAVAAAFPPTQIEKEALGPLGDEMSKAAGEFGDQVKQATSKAGEKLKTAADQRGLNTETLRGLADEALDTFKASMQGQPRDSETTEAEALARSRSPKGNRP